MDAVINFISAGLVPYGQALQWQERLWAARCCDEVGDTLLLLQHTPVITLGEEGGEEDLHLSPDQLQDLGFELHQTNRGGRATYHGPGQLVAYPIVRLSDGDLHAYLWKLEETVIGLLGDWGIEASRVLRYPGVWVGREKIAAVGVSVRSGVTMHGLALNVNTDLSHFGVITPCGIKRRGVTSMQALLDRSMPMAEVEDGFVRSFSTVFGREVRPAPSSLVAYLEAISGLER